MRPSWRFGRKARPRLPEPRQPPRAERPCVYAGLRSGRYAGTGRSFGPVAEAADVGDAAAAHGEDLPAPGRPAFLASGRCAGDLQPHQKRPGPGGHLRDHCPRADRSRAGPPGDDLIAVAAVGIAGTLRRAQRAPGSSRSLTASRSPDSRADLTRPASAAGSSAALASSAMKISACGAKLAVQPRRDRHPSGAARRRLRADPRQAIVTQREKPSRS